MMNTPGWFAEFFRGIFAALDGLGYWLLEGIYDVFFAVANAEILSGNAMSDLYLRLQLIFGVFMIFKLSLTILNIIINPDNYKDKQKGAGSIVVRVAVMLIMLTLVLPINIQNPNGNKLYERMNDNGILFGFLYQFQDSVIRENVLGKLILGSNVEYTADSNNMSDMGGMMALATAKAFMTPTLINDEDSTTITDEDSFVEENTACYTELDAIHYFDSATRPSYLLDHINETCNNDEAGGEVFAMQYTIIGGFVFSIVMGIIVLGFTVDIAVRSIKLAVLRIIAPVPIISYITPGAEKDGAFGNWVKTLTSTYIDLFIRLAVISFGAYIIVLLMDDDGGLNIITTSTNWFTSGLATIFVIIGILVFMKQAPKFFKDMFGIKSDTSLFGGVGAALGGAALVGGLAGSTIGSFKTGVSEGKELGLSRGRQIFRGVRSGAGGLIGGAYAGGKAFMSNDKKIPSSVFSSMQKRNALRSTGSTFLGRTKSGAAAMLMGSSLGGKASKMADLYDNLTKAAQAHKSMVEDEALKDTVVTGSAVVGKDDRGNDITMTGNYRDIENLIENARARGQNRIKLRNGQYIGLDRINGNVMEQLKQSQAANYLASDAGRGNVKIQGTAKDLQFAANRVDMKIDAYKYDKYEGDRRPQEMSLKGVIGASINAARDVKSDPRAQYNIADDKAINNTNK